ncbi:methyltransferase domain-containing protein [Stenotrophomonas sp. CPCC 101365]|uniref:Methyltransferase domain-containing protein n=1 Tax=Stenotrophomonas mori TaxID=2871096 RepID=A0ABT0SCY3_9GAMM|nr:methyltransferase domain-containing protein [Stenotrophomonas mori]
MAPAQPLRGHCPLCRAATDFQGDPQGNIRERLYCGNCGCNARQRAAARVLLEALEAAGTARVYATEQASLFYRTLRGRVGQLHGGEYGVGLSRRWRLQLWLWRHGVFERVVLRDLTALEFADAGLDAVISLDVLEHIVDTGAALREAARVLRPGGVFVFTVPFYPDKARSRQIARLRDDGQVVFEGRPEYHGDPVSGGVPCFHHFGWDLLAMLREAGFADARVLRVHDPGAGLPQGQWVFRARR